MKLLALDTATEACSAALYRDGAIDERYEVIGRGHATRLLPMADELLAGQRELDEVVRPKAELSSRRPTRFVPVRLATSSDTWKYERRS